MQQIFHEIKINAKGQGFYDFTNETVSWLNKQKINEEITSKGGRSDYESEIFTGFYQFED